MKSKPLEETTNFIEDIINEDIKSGRFEASSCVQTRHPPEPSGYLHIGHAKNIIINYGTAEKFGGVCNLRYDDTNPKKESQEFVDAIQEDVQWLGYKWHDIHYATDYFQQNYEKAIDLIKEGKAYVCDLTPEEVTDYRGTLTEPGKNSPYRDRTIEENLALFEKMKNGEFAQGSCSLRAKIDMASPNMNMRDPVIYRIQYAHHQRIGNKWNIYPSYDFSHPMDDSLEGVTHSMCGMDFRDHRPLYDWVIENCHLKTKSRQVESGLLLLRGVVLGKRNIKQLVEKGIVDGWDDPRLYTLRALKRRGVTPEAIKNFVRAAGITTADCVCERSFFEHFVRQDLNDNARRVLAVLKPLECEVVNVDESFSEACEIEDYPQKEESTKRIVNFTKHFYIEKDDFITHQDPKFYRMQVGGEVRLKGAYIVKCVGYDVDEKGDVNKLKVEVDLDTKSGSGCTKKVKGTIHWLSKIDAVSAQVNLYDNLINEQFNNKIIESTTFDESINPNSKHVLTNCFVEKGIDYEYGKSYQFLRLGYFCLDKVSTANKLVFNHTISLKEDKDKK